MQRQQSAGQDTLGETTWIWNEFTLPQRPVLLTAMRPEGHKLHIQVILMGNADSRCDFFSYLTCVSCTNFRKVTPLKHLEKIIKSLRFPWNRTAALKAPSEESQSQAPQSPRWKSLFWRPPFSWAQYTPLSPEAVCLCRHPFLALLYL